MVKKLTWSCVTTLFVIFLERKESMAAAALLVSPFLGVVRRGGLTAAAAAWLDRCRCSWRTRRSTWTKHLSVSKKNKDRANNVGNGILQTHTTYES